MTRPSTVIQAIPKESVHRICSGQVILDLATAVKVRAPPPRAGPALPLPRVPGNGNAARLGGGETASA